MSRSSRWVALAAVTGLAILAVLWFGDDARDEVNAFLRALARVL